MKKLIFSIAALALIAQAAIGQSDSTEVYRLEAVSVSGSRVPLQLGQSARMVTVLDSVAIASLPARTVNDVLKYAVGVDVRQRGVEGMQTDISMRGGTSDQIAVLLNGINICDPQTGHNAVDLPLDMSDIERIEVLEGPAGRVYGTSSLVGAVNIVTKSGDERGVAARLEAGSYGYFLQSVRASIPTGKVRGSLSVCNSFADGYLRNSEGGLSSDFHSLKAFYQGGTSLRDVDLNWHAGVSSRDFGSNTFYSSKYDNQFESTLKTFTAIQARTKRGFLRLRPSVYWNYSRDRFELFRGDPSAVPFNHHRTNVFGANLGADFETVLGKTAFGAEIRYEDIISTNLGDALDNPIKVPGYDAYYKVGLDRTNYTMYLEHNLVLSRLTLSGGLAAVKNTGNDAGFGFYPGFDASLRISGDWKVYASFNSSLRQPTFTDLYYSVGGHKADRNLRPEKMQALEGGVKYLRSGVRAIASVYYHHGSDMIDWIRDTSEGEDALWKSVNYTRINTLGEELTLRFDVAELLGRRSFFLSRVNLGYSHINQDKDIPANIQSLYALEYLVNKVLVQADFTIVPGLDFNLSYSWRDRRGNYASYALLDARLSYAIGKWNVFADVDNILDKTYYDHGDVPQPGIWAKIGASVNLGF